MQQQYNAETNGAEITGHPHIKQINTYRAKIIKYVQKQINNPWHKSHILYKKINSKWIIAVNVEPKF